MVLSLRRRSLSRFLILVGVIVSVKLFLFPSSPLPSSPEHQIKGHNFIERATRPDKSLNVQKHRFLQARMGRDERDELMGDVIRNGANDYWERYQKP